MSDRLEEIKAVMRGIKGDMSILERVYTAAGGKLGAALSDGSRQHNSCPLCGDATGFSIFRNETGGPRWKCWSKCGAVGGSVVDLVIRLDRVDLKEAGKRLRARFATGVRGSGFGVQGERQEGTTGRLGDRVIETPAPKKLKKRYMSLNQAADAFLWVLQNKRGHPDARITQINSFDFENGKPFGRTVRYEFTKPDGTVGKEFSPFRYADGAWIVGMEEKPRALWPMFNLPTLLKAVEQHSRKGAEAQSNAK